MSGTQFETTEMFAGNPRLAPYDAYHDGYEAYNVYGVYDVHSAPTLPYGYGGDTYRPAPPVHEPTAPALPRQSDGRAERRRRARGAGRPDVSLRRLLPRALVVAFLAGGTTAFVAKDKAVELTVDGTPRTLHTFADDVTELLAEEGVRVGAHDVVAPAPGTPLTSGEDVTVRYGRPVLLTLDGHRRQVWTTAETVEGRCGGSAYGPRARTCPPSRPGASAARASPWWCAPSGW